MSTTSRFFGFCVLALLGAGMVLQSCSQPMISQSPLARGPADVIYYNGNIITMWEEHPVVEAVAISQGRILAVGTSSEVERLASTQTVRIDLQGTSMVPGLIDGHVHPISAALAEQNAPIPEIGSFEDIRVHVEEKAKEIPSEELIFVPKVYSTRLKERRYPTNEELDSFASEHKVMLDNGYACVLNSAALKAAGINRRTPDPANGKVIRNPDTRKPTGLILGARQLVSGLLRERTISPDDRLWALKAMQEAYNRAGLTSVIDGWQEAEGLRVYQKFEQSGEMTVRTCVTMAIDAEAPIEEVRKAIMDMGAVSGFGNNFLRIGHLKFSLDGGILIGTAYLREPYGENTGVYGFHDPAYRGVLRVPREKVFEIVSLANRLGWRVTAHTTGGASTDLLLEAYEKADQELSIRDRRFSLIHANFPNAGVLKKAKRLGVVLDMQPAWYHLDGLALSEILGPERMKTFHPYKSAFDAGVVVAGGSDHMIKFDSKSAINPYHPFFGMWMVITRETSDGTVFNPEERITREQALRMWTLNPAYNSFEEEVKGSIEPGKFADLTIISKDYLTCPEDEIKDIEALVTIVGGKVVYSDDEARNYSF